MAKEIIMPKMGMTMETGTVLKWLVKEGDFVEKGDVMLSVETDKAVLDVEAFEAGTLLKILVQEGESAPVLTCIGYIGDAGEKIEAAAPEADVQEKVSEPANESKTEVKASAEAVHEANGVRATPLARAICAKNNISLNSVQPNSEGIITKKEALAAEKQLEVKATPTAEKMALENGINIADVPHEGRRVFKQDVEAVLNSTVPEDAEYYELGKIQKIAGEMLTKSWQTMPMVTNCIELDVSESLKLADFLNKRYGEKLNTKFGLTDIMIKVLAQALAQNPNANVYYENGRLRRLNGINIGLAAATPKGLVVPVIRNADKLNVMEINREKNRLVEAARTGRLSPADMGGAGTTLSNMGGYRAEIFTPIINYPESCIFGTGTVKKKAVVIDDEIVIRPMMWLNFTYDHRVLDGEQAAKLLNAVKDVTEFPSLFIGYEGTSR